ncbi:MAG: AAA family ATPase, partial [Mycobacteriales bacterium]
PSALQALYDQRGPSTGHPPFRVILCGSAVSVMSTLLAGDHALRGRAVMDMRIGPFDYRSSAAYWRCPPQTALLVDAVLGGAPGYRDLIGDAPEAGPDGLYAWLERTVCNPSHTLFNEPDYLLAEDPKLGNRAIYHAIWDAVASGATTPTQIGGLVGADARSLSYHLTFMRDAGFIRYDQDILLQRHPVITVADPVVRFHNLIVRPNLAEFELRAGAAVWGRVQDTFSSKILGPHFEALARDWTIRYAHEVGLGSIGPTGTTVVACKEHRGHEVDVLAFERGSRPRDRAAPIVLLGEAKSTRQPRTIADLHRLEHIRDLLDHLGWNVADTSFVLFSRNGFTTELANVALHPGNRRRTLHLLDLDSMYAG